MKESEKLVIELLSGDTGFNEMEIRDHLRKMGVDEHEIWLVTEGSLVDMPAGFLPFPGALARPPGATVKIKTLSYDNKVIVWELEYTKASLSRYYGQRTRQPLLGYPPHYAPAMPFGNPPEPVGLDKNRLVLRRYMRSAGI